MKRYTFVLAMVLWAAPMGLEAQQRSPEARIEAARRQAQGGGIPVALLDNLIAQGRAKGAPMDRIAVAVERRAVALTRAHDAMRGARGLTAADLAAGADAVEAGIEEGSLRTLIGRAKAEDRPVAIAVLTYLHREGMPVDNALERVSDALAKGPDALRELPAQARAVGRRNGAGRPEGVGRAPGGVAKGGPPSALPTPGQRPGSGRPEGVGQGNSKGQGKGRPN